MQQTSKPKTRRKYDADFKSEVVKILVSGQNAAYISKDLGISENLPLEELEPREQKGN